MFTRSDTVRVQVRQVPVILLSSKKVCLPSGIHPGAMYPQLPHFIPRGFRARLVPQGTRALQTSAEGTTSRVFTRPQPKLSFATLSLFLGCK